ncbi:MAG: hypothetical protein P4M08_03475 [Oligoflexia bacterium]|nr:hypothetical protein [Oligoflexia bacterium]
MKSFFLLTLLVAISLPVGARADEFHDLVAQLESSNVVTTTRAFYTYHYATAGAFRLPAIDLNNPAVRQDLKLWSQEYLQNPPVNQAFMLGFYAAIDPERTRDYAGKGSDFLLDRVEIPAGFKMLSILQEEFPEPARWEAYLEANGCSAQRLKGLFWMQEPGELPNCRAIGARMAKALGVDAIQYGYPLDELKGCAGTKSSALRDSFALIIIRPDHIPKSAISQFGASVRPDADGLKEQRILNELFHLDHILRVFPDVDYASEAEVNEYKAAHLLGCENLGQ